MASPSLVRYSFSGSKPLFCASSLAANRIVKTLQVRIITSAHRPTKFNPQHHNRLRAVAHGLPRGSAKTPFASNHLLAHASASVGATLSEVDFSQCNNSASVLSGSHTAPFHSSPARRVIVSGMGEVNDPPTSGLNFDDVSQSFAAKSDLEILRAILVFRLSAIRPLVKHARSMLQLADKVVGKRVTSYILKKTFFGHFCAGEDSAGIQPAINRLAEAGIGSILDYAAEADVSEQLKRDRTGIQSARVYDYEGEAECDANMHLSLSSIDTAGIHSEGDAGFVAIKVTALGKPELLERMSLVLMQTKRMFKMFAAQELFPDARHSPRINLEQNQISFEMFQRGLKAIKLQLSPDQETSLFKRIDSDGSGSIDYLEWVSYLSPRALGTLIPKWKSEGLPRLSDEDQTKMSSMISRLEQLADRAAQKKTRLMIDAEQTYFQPAIDHLVLHLQRKYNRKIPLIYGTYQLYLVDSKSRLVVDLARAKKEGFYFACKAVRGAYMIQERKRAKAKDIEDPIHATLQDTHQNYDACVGLLLDSIKQADVMVATHNENTVKLVTKLMAEKAIPKKGGGVFFGQLLGMCDHISFSLGHCGYGVYKYVPFGPVHQVIPYLLRRAEENSDLLGGATKERTLLWNEFLRRRLPFLAKAPHQLAHLKQDVHKPVAGKHDEKTTA